MIHTQKNFKLRLQSSELRPVYFRLLGRTPVLQEELAGSSEMLATIYKTTCQHNPASNNLICNTLKTPPLL